LSGILIENELSGATPRYSLVGIGVNVNFDIPQESEISDLATSIKQELDREVPRADLMASILNHFEDVLDEVNRSGAIVREWEQRLDTLGRRISVSLQGRTYEGVASGVNEEGSLLLQRDDGTVLTLEAGEVSLRPPEVVS
jgi:BirA family biotin operon repressor/biotin-[acetyl-CoA-carboxylase] ligase